MGECSPDCCGKCAETGTGTIFAGRRWEYPVPKSKEYWEKFCRDEEKRLIVVRDPSVQLSYNSFPKHRSSKFRARSPPDSENSLQKLSLLKSKSRSNKFENNDKESFPKPILKLSAETRSKNSRSANFDAPSKAERVPKLDVQRSDLNFGKSRRNKENCTRGSSSAQNKPKARSLLTSTLPILSALPTASTRKPKLVKSRREESVDRKLFPEIKSTRCRTDLPSPKTTGSRIDEDSLKYSIRRAYKALKHVTANKELNFDPETVFESTKGSSAIVDEERKLHGSIDGGKSEESNKEFLRWKESLKDSQSIGIDARRATSKLEETSSTIPSGSRSTSGLSPRFAHIEPWEGSSSRVLSSIPKLSSFQRGRRDRCLPCIYKSFELQSDRKTSLPVTTLHRIINSPARRVVSSNRSEDSDSSVCLPDLEDTLERILNGEFDAKKVTFHEPDDVSESRIVRETPTAREHREEASRTTEQSGPESESSRKAITQKDKEYRRDGETVSAEKSPNDAAKFERAATLERSKLSASLRSDSTEDDDSLAVSLDEDQSRPKYLAPCHMPTVFKPSLEPLRALRNRKPTTLQERIAFLESSSKKSWSLDDDAQEKQAKPSRPEEIKAEKSDPVGRALTKAKSMPESLILENAERAKKEHVLRKGHTVADLAVQRDTGDERVSTDGTADGKSGLEGSAKTTVEVSQPETRLPLTDIAEVVEILQNLEEETSAASMLDALSKEFSERLSASVSTGDTVTERNEKTIGSLTSLLVDSKRYLDPERFPSDLSFSSNQPPPCNPQLLKQILPEKSYNLVAPLLGLPIWYPERKRTSFRPSDDIDPGRVSKPTGADDDHSLASFEVHPPTSRDSKSLNGEEKVGHRRYNPYALFLRKPRRKVITWRPLVTDDLEGYDPNATLKMRTDNIMSKICQDFCQWLNTLGGTDKTVDEQVLKDMFEIDFNAEACRAMQVLTREMPVVPAEVARTRNSLAASKLSMTKKQVLKDARAEERPPKMTAFGTTMPWHLQFAPPKNQVRETWLECRHVPTDLETMDVVWKDITNLKSVRGFVEWLQQHPEISPPDPLKELVATDVETLRQVEDDEEFAHLELDIYQIKSFRVVDTDGQ
ncbi:uncharacterized protein LOC144472308 [Augochlora pura]